MAGVNETISAVNSFIRTVLAMVVFGTIGLGGWLGYDAYQSRQGAWREKQRELLAAQKKLSQQENLLAEKASEISQLNTSLAERDVQVTELTDELAVSQQKVIRLETSLQFLKVDHRLAHITVIQQRTDPDSKTIYSRIRFVEVNDEGTAIDNPRTFEIEGDKVYVDYWVVKFDDKYVETADVDRASSICLFRRIFGEFQEPSNGFALDKIGSRPMAYARGGKMSDFERTIWSDFWNIANDPHKAKEMGIRAAHGDAVYTHLQEGRTYRLLLRASGGLSITPIDS